MSATGESFDSVSFLWRFLFAIALVFSTYNPSGYSYIHWFAGIFPAITPILAITGVILVIGWAVYLNATTRALGAVGLILMSILFAAVIWLFVDLGWLRLSSVSVVTWLILVLLSLLLAIGMSWSHIQRRLSGQLDVDEIEN
jgi:hypothetical protein